jgi:hypothetical protein
VWVIYGNASDSLHGYGASNAIGVLPAIWLASAVSTTGGSGTYNNPYCLVANDPLCLANLIIMTTTGSAGDGITLTGTAKASENNQNMTVWADACNVAGQCVRKMIADFDLASSGTAQEWMLTWAASELPTGTYDGTRWVGLTTAAGETIIDALSAQSGPVNFTIDAVVRTFLVTVIESQPFSLEVGAVSNYDLGASSLPATNNGVTASNVGGKLVIASTTGLASNTTATFGNTKFEITVIPLPQLTVSNVNLE